MRKRDCFSNSSKLAEAWDATRKLARSKPLAAGPVGPAIQSDWHNAPFKDSGSIIPNPIIFKAMVLSDLEDGDIRQREIEIKTKTEILDLNCSKLIS